MNLELTNNYIKITKSVDFLEKDEVYEINSSQNNITKGLEVTDNWGNVRLVPHGSYEDYKPERIKIKTETEEKIFSIILTDKNHLLELIEKASQEIKEETAMELSWSLEEFVYCPYNKESTSLIRLTTIKDSHIHNSTPLWLSACKDFACKLQSVLKQKDFKAYVTNATLYNFTTNAEII